MSMELQLEGYGFERTCGDCVGDPELVAAAMMGGSVGEDYCALCSSLEGSYIQLRLLVPD